MKQTWRWFGPDDLVTLDHVRQAGATGVVTALHQHNRGEAWPTDAVARRKAEVEAAGLTWSVVESIAVHEDIKTRSGRWRERIEAYRASIRAIAAVGVRTLCYNFMAITDWTRTDLAFPMPHGGTALRFDMVEFAAYDAFVLRRPGAEADHPAERLAAARARLDAMSESDLARLERNLIDWVPAREFVYDRDGFRRARPPTPGSGPRISAPICSSSSRRSCRSPRRKASNWRSTPTTRRSRCSDCRG